MTEMEKNFRDLEELFKLGMLDAEGYAFQKKQLEEEMARESGQAQAATGGTVPIQQETAPPPKPAVNTDGMSADEIKDLGVATAKAGDFAKAVELWHMAADMGNITAQAILGECYGKGQGVPLDFVKSLEWYEKAAAQGDAKAMYRIGVLYNNGMGVIKLDFAKAEEWFNKAIAAGDEKVKEAAKERLAELKQKRER